MKKYLLLTALLLGLFSHLFAQFVCGFPVWSSKRAYSVNSYVVHNNTVYKNTQWLQGDAPGSNSLWVSQGACGEQILINNPSLAYTDVAKATEWNSQTANYNTGNVVLYNGGAYQAQYWVAGTDRPDLSEAYTFLGVSVTPIDINPSYADNQVVIQPSLSSLSLNATLNTHGYTVKSSSIDIKEVASVNYDIHTTSVTAGAMNYSWTPSKYGDFQVRYTATNSVGVATTVVTTLKIAASVPPSVQINSPQEGDRFSQLRFSPIQIKFQAAAANGNTIKTLSVSDEQSGDSKTLVTNDLGEYTYGWTPAVYGSNTVSVTVTDNRGTSVTKSISVWINNPAIENISSGALPYQLKVTDGISKKFIFDKAVASLTARDFSLFSYTISNGNLTITSNRPGRSGLAISFVDGTKAYMGLRVDNADGSVPKYPDHVSIGSVSEDIDDDVNFYNNGMDGTNLLKNNRMDVRYTYINGGPVNGWSSWQPDRAIKFARNSLKMGLIPFFIFYNLPDGGESYTTDLEHARDPAYMKAYFENMDLFLSQVKKEVDDEFFGVILEPDFLGYMQQNNEPTTSPTAVSATTIGANAGTLKALVERINAEMNAKRAAYKLHMDYGWQLNLWAKPNVAGLRGIIRETDNGDFSTQLAKIRQTAADIFGYAHSLGIMTSDADFISIDKYGLDAMGYSSSSTASDPSTYTWFWNNDHWKNYLDFVNSLHKVSGKPVILWQIPVGHINGSTTVNEYTGKPFVALTNTTKRFEDSATSFFLGDEMDFSTDLVRYNYFSQNKHADPKLVVNSTTKRVVWGNHMEEVKSAGSHLVLMGAGVGDSSDGIGNAEGSAPTLTDDHFWIQKVQDYYINHLVEDISSVILAERDIEFNSPAIYYSHNMVKWAENVEGKTIHLLDFTGKVLFTQSISAKHSVSVESLHPGAYIVVLTLDTGDVWTQKFIKE